MIDLQTCFGFHRNTLIHNLKTAALEICPGRPLVNSIGGEKKILEENLPIPAERGLPVIVLCMGQEGIPDNVDGRLRAANQVMEAAVQAGMRKEDIIFDPSVMTVGADDQAARIALETLQRLRIEFPNNNITSGASNVSFGMPDHLTLNAGFLTATCLLGMNIPITDPTNIQLRSAVSTVGVLLGRDRRTRSYMRSFRQRKLQSGV